MPKLIIINFIICIAHVGIEFFITINLINFFAMEVMRTPTVPRSTDSFCHHKLSSNPKERYKSRKIQSCDPK